MHNYEQHIDYDCNYDDEFADQCYEPANDGEPDFWGCGDDGYCYEGHSDKTYVIGVLIKLEQSARYNGYEMPKWAFSRLQELTMATINERPHWLEESDIWDIVAYHANKLFGKDYLTERMKKEYVRPPKYRTKIVT